MRRYILDFIFDERTGESQVVIDFQDDSLTALEINEAIRGGEIREEILALAESVLGSEVAGGVRAGRIPLVCLDHEPRKPGAGGQAQTQPEGSRQKAGEKQ